MTKDRNILMIDRNFMIDRRIILESKLLSEMGNSVVLVATYGSIGDNERVINGLPILRFCEAKSIHDGDDPTYKNFKSFFRNDILKTIDDQISNKFTELSRLRFEKNYALFNKFLGQKLGLTIAIILSPNFSSKRIILSHRLSRLAKLSASFFLGLLSFNFSNYINYKKTPHIKGLSRSDEIKLEVTKLRFERSCLQVRNLPRAKNGLHEMWRKISYPMYGLEEQRTKNSRNFLFSSILIFLTLNSYIIKNYYAFVNGKFPFLSKTHYYLEHASKDVAEYFLKNPLDFWEEKVFNFSCSLDQVDVVHAHDLPTLRVAVLIALKRGIPLIYDAHELYSHQPGVVGERKKYLFSTENLLIKYCNKVVVINSDQAEVMGREHGVNNFVPLTNATEQPIDFDITKRYSLVRDLLGISADSKLMLFMGGINRSRKIDILLEGLAKSKFKDIHMVFLTWGMEIAVFKEMALYLGLGARVHFLDPVPWSEIVYWAASVDVGVMPYQALDLNTKISSPNKMYEFITAGTPMIGSSELVNVSRVVGREGFGVLRPLHVAEDYALVIDEMFDPKLGGANRFRSALVKNAHKYLWGEESKSFELMYSEILTGLN